MRWHVHIPAGRWMAGVRTFRTKQKAVAFIVAWNATEAKSGKPVLDFIRLGEARRFVSRAQAEREYQQRRDQRWFERFNS